MNVHAIRAIYGFEMARTRRTLMQSIVSPVLSTSLYFVVFGAAIGARIQEIGGIGYGSFIVPGLIMLSLLTQSVANASFGIYFPRFTGTIYELLSAPVSYFEIVVSYVGAAATKSIILGLIILATATLFVPWATSCETTVSVPRESRRISSLCASANACRYDRVLIARPSLSPAPSRSGRGSRTGPDPSARTCSREPTP